jgi:hypothetical protein
MSITKLPTLYAVEDFQHYSRYGENNKILVLYYGFNYQGCNKIIKYGSTFKMRRH